MTASRIARRLFPGLSLGLALAATLFAWWHYGTAFYDRVIPFYDSVSYQETYRATAAVTQSQGIYTALVETWKETDNNVVLHRFFAAILGSVLTSPREGLFVYLFAWHTLATLALYSTVRRLSGSDAQALFAVAAWLAVTPFGLLRDGVGDQRMDLATASAYLLIASLVLRWMDQPSLRFAGLAGTAAALAALHRPVIVPSLAALGIVAFSIALWRHRQSRRKWTPQALAALLPIASLDAPWFIHHVESLRYYYFEFGPDVGNASSFGDALQFNLAAHGRSLGIASAIALAVGYVASFRIRPRLHAVHLMSVGILWAIPLAVLIATKSAANLFVQQVSLGIPALGLAALTSRDLSTRWIQRTAIAVLFVVVLITPFRLARSLGTERPGAKAEVQRVLEIIANIDPNAQVAGFHDLPASVVSMMAVARDLDLDLRAGTNCFYPSEFGLPFDHDEDVGSETVRAAVRATLDRIASSDQLVILPTASTSFRLWQGLYSHRLLGLIREEILKHHRFEPVSIAGPIQEIYFDLYRIR